MDIPRQSPHHPGMLESLGDMERANEPEYRPITVAEFNKMVETGIIGEDERVELVDGALIVMPPMGAPHASTVARVADLVQRRLSDRALIWPQLPVVASDLSQPQPDIAVVSRRGDFYEAELPRPADIFAVVEVSDSMLSFDRGPKLNMYARAAIGEYWIVDVKARTIEICREPHEIGYASRRVVQRGESASFAAFPDVVFSVDELLG